MPEPRPKPRPKLCLEMSLDLSLGAASLNHKSKSVGGINSHRGGMRKGIDLELKLKRHCCVVGGFAVIVEFAGHICNVVYRRYECRGGVRYQLTFSTTTQGESVVLYPPPTTHLPLSQLTRHPPQPLRPASLSPFPLNFHTPIHSLHHPHLPPSLSTSTLLTLFALPSSPSSSSYL